MTTPRKRSRQPLVTLPEARGNKRYVALVRGQRYHFLPANQVFENGAPQEVSEEVYNHLAAHAVDSMSYTDPGLGKVRRTIRKFTFAPELPEVAEEVVLGW